MSEDDQHINMARDYIDPMASSLATMFGMSLQDAKDLCWGGLQDTSQYRNLTQAEKNRISLTNGNHKTSASGTRCP